MCHITYQEFPVYFFLTYTYMNPLCSHLFNYVLHELRVGDESVCRLSNRSLIIIVLQSTYMLFSKSKGIITQMITLFIRHCKIKLSGQTDK